MDTKNDMNAQEIQLDADNLYREEVYTDFKTGSIRRLIPVKPDGSQDYTRKGIFVGQTHLVSPQGSLPIQSRIEAKNLKEAIDKYPAVMKQTIEKMFEKVEEMKRQEESRIIVPGSTSSGKIVQP